MQIYNPKDFAEFGWSYVVNCAELVVNRTGMRLQKAQRPSPAPTAQAAAGCEGAGVIVGEGDGNVTEMHPQPRVPTNSTHAASVTISALFKKFIFTSVSDTCLIIIIPTTGKK